MDKKLEKKYDDEQIDHVHTNMQPIPDIKSLWFKSEGFDKAYIKELEERLKLSELFAYGNLIGWAITVILFVYLK